MTISKRSGLAALLAMAVAGAVAPASAAWWGDGRWHPDPRWNNPPPPDRYYNGYHYRAPPVVYGTPYNYGYYPPPVVYDNTPSFSITIPLR